MSDDVKTKSGRIARNQKEVAEAAEAYRIAVLEVERIQRQIDELMGPYLAAIVGAKSTEVYVRQRMADAIARLQAS